MTYFIFYVVLMILTWIAGWFYMLHVKFHNENLRETDKIDIYFAFGFGGLMWPLAIPIVAIVIPIRYLWNLAGQGQDRLVEYFKRPKPTPPAPIYGESKGYRQPPKVI